jgi:PAS domain S-box-containing protein
MLYDRKGAPSDYRFLEVNTAFEQQTGLRSADILGKTALELFPDVERCWIEKFGKIASTGASERFEEFNHNTGRYYETFAYSPEKSSIFLLIRDITKSKCTERALRESEHEHADALLRNEKLASFGRMAASIAHEINNPLAATTNLLYLASKVPGLPESSREYIELAQAELNRVAHFTRQSLGFYREASGPIRIRLGPLLDTAVELFQAKINSRRAVVVKSWNSEFEVTAVPGELLQIFSNILANSLDALDQHGTVRIKVSGACAASGAPGVRITIADNGRGIPAAARSQVFEPFFTTKGAIGTGLGLWVSRQLADKHNGRIRMRSAITPPAVGLPSPSPCLPTSDTLACSEGAEKVGAAKSS